MKPAGSIEGFSKLAKEEKIRIISEFIRDPSLLSEISSYWHPSNQQLFDQFSENTITNYTLPFGIAPNFLINGKIYHVPMVTEESSVVAAASAAAKFWLERGGFQSVVIYTLKKGHVHFLWHGNKTLLETEFEKIKARILDDVLPLTQTMNNRGGGIRNVVLEDYSDKIPAYYRLAVDFETVDSMGANFINTLLEGMAASLKSFFQENWPNNSQELEVVMSILSNLNPDCTVQCTVESPFSYLEFPESGLSGIAFARKFKTAVDIACVDPFRATTHNKGIMNGIDAVVIATGNDFRAIEAGSHAYASLSGSYKSLSEVSLSSTHLSFTLRLPLTVGTVGGLTSLHPVAKRAMQILGNPTAKELMTIIASVGLASNFAAIKALITQGIQKGHMKMHLSNILNQFQLSENQKQQTESYFRGKPISYGSVKEFIIKEFNYQS